MCQSFSSGRSSSFEDIWNVKAQIYISSPFSQLTRMPVAIIYNLDITNVLDVFNLLWGKQSPKSFMNNLFYNI